MDNNELKITALKDTISNLSATHADREADLRVEITLLAQQNQELQARNAELEGADEVSLDEAE